MLLLNIQVVVLFLWVFGELRSWSAAMIFAPAILHIIIVVGAILLKSLVEE